MSLYKRGNKKVFYMILIIARVSLTRSTGKFTKKEARLVEAVEKKWMMVDVDKDDLNSQRIPIMDVIMFDSS